MKKLLALLLALALMLTFAACTVKYDDDKDDKDKTSQSASGDNDNDDGDKDSDSDKDDDKDDDSDKDEKPSENKALIWTNCLNRTVYDNVTISMKAEAEDGDITEQVCVFDGNNIIVDGVDMSGDGEMIELTRNLMIEPVCKLLESAIVTYHMEEDYFETGAGACYASGAGADAYITATNIRFTTDDEGRLLTFTCQMKQEISFPDEDAKVLNYDVAFTFSDYGTSNR